MDEAVLSCVKLFAIAGGLSLSVGFILRFILVWTKVPYPIGGVCILIGYGAAYLLMDSAGITSELLPQFRVTYSQVFAQLVFFIASVCFILDVWRKDRSGIGEALGISIFALIPASSLIMGDVITTEIMIIAALMIILAAVISLRTYQCEQVNSMGVWMTLILLAGVIGVNLRLDEIEATYTCSMLAGGLIAWIVLGFLHPRGSIGRSGLVPATYTALLIASSYLAMRETFYCGCLLLLPVASLLLPIPKPYEQGSVTYPEYLELIGWPRRRIMLGVGGVQLALAVAAIVVAKPYQI